MSHVYLLPLKTMLTLPFAQCGQAVCGTAQTQAHDPSLSNAPALTSLLAPPLTPCEKYQSA